MADTCLGELYLNLTQFNLDVTDVNTKLGSLGKGVKFEKDFHLRYGSLSREVTAVINHLDRIKDRQIHVTIDTAKLDADVKAANAILAGLTTPPAWPTGSITGGSSGGSGSSSGSGGKSKSAEDDILNTLRQIEAIRQRLQSAPSGGA